MQARSPNLFNRLLGSKAMPLRMSIIRNLMRCLNTRKDGDTRYGLPKIGELDCDSITKLVLEQIELFEPRIQVVDCEIFSIDSEKIAIRIAAKVQDERQEIEIQIGNNNFVTAHSNDFKQQ